MSLKTLRQTLDNFPKRHIEPKQWGKGTTESLVIPSDEEYEIWRKDFVAEFGGLEQKLLKLYVKLCEDRIGDIGADNKCFLIEELFDAETEELFAKAEKLGLLEGSQK